MAQANQVLRCLVSKCTFSSTPRILTTCVLGRSDRGVSGSSLGNSHFTRFSSSALKQKKEKVLVHFMRPDGSKLTANAKVGDNLLDVIIDNDLDIDGFGACEGTLACSTCHLIFKQADYNKLPETPTDEELDMLDLAFGLTETSRLGCQVIVSKDMDGLEVSVPDSVADARGPS